MGLAGAAGVRPFLPALLSGALGRADLGVNFTGTRYAFLESNWFLIAVVVLLIVTVLIERRSPGAAESGTFGAALGGIAIGIGALLFAGSLADHGETSWAWLAPGIACALVGQAAARSLFGRVARRLDPQARAALPLYADGGSLAAAALAHLIPNMNWYHRGEARYVEYGSSFAASRTFGIHRSLLDTIYNMNLAHLSPEVETVFESLDDAEVRTAGTTFLIYRGRHRHEIARETPIAGLVNRTLFRHGASGPRELSYADIFPSRRTGR